MNELSQHRGPRIGWLAVVAIVAIAVCCAAWIYAPRQFYLAYLAAILLPWSISMGSLALLLTFGLTGGKWGRAAWPWLATNARLMPLVALLFLVWLLGIKYIYPWANSDILSQFKNTANRQWYYQTPFYIGRTVFYFAIWSALAWLATGFSSRRNTDTDRSQESPEPQAHLEMQIIGGQPIAGLGLIAILLTVTWAGNDWVMSFDPFFKSTLFGALIGMGGMLAAMSAAVAAVCFWPRLHEAANDEKAISDLSGLLLAFLMLWAYFSFAQFLIMWTGDLPIEARFYVLRSQGIWAWIGPVLALGGFALPFLCLLSFDLKRTPKQVGTLAVCLLFVRLVELWWMILPAGGDQDYSGLHWAVIPATVAVVAIYLLALVWFVRRGEPLARREVLSGR
jgi:hypothetical protein